MIKTILAHLNGTDCDRPVLETGLQAARLHAGHLDCSRVIPDPAVLLAQASQIDVGAPMVAAGMPDSMEKQSRKRTQSARDALAELHKREDIVYADAPPWVHTATAGFANSFSADLPRKF